MRAMKKMSFNEMNDFVHKNSIPTENSEFQFETNFHNQAESLYVEPTKPSWSAVFNQIFRKKNTISFFRKKRQKFNLLAQGHGGKKGTKKKGPHLLRPIIKSRQASSRQSSRAASGNSSQKKDSISSDSREERRNMLNENRQGIENDRNSKTAIEKKIYDIRK